MPGITGGFVKTHIAGPYPRGSDSVGLELEGGGWFAFLRSPQVIQMMLVWGLHFENHWSKVFSSLLGYPSGDDLDVNSNKDRIAHT